jgi:formylglycine-generating enzyme required for sulfatase activity
MNDFPLNLFLTSLADDGIMLTARDLRRLVMAFQTQGRWTLTRLKNVLSVILAKDTDQQRLIIRKFDKFFKAETEIEKKLPEIDVQLLLKQLRAAGTGIDTGVETDTQMGMGPMGIEAESDSEPIPEIRRTFVKKQDIPASQRGILETTSKKYLPWILGTIMVLAVLVFIFIRFFPAPIPKMPTNIAVEPRLELSPLAHNFGVQKLNKTAKQAISLTNTGNAPLIIENIRIQEAGTKKLANGDKKQNSEKIFQISLPLLPLTLSQGQSIKIPVTFTPRTVQNYKAELKILHNAENSSDTVSLLGTGQGATPNEAKRLYPDVPYVKDTIYEAPERSKEWLIYAGISAIILLLTLLYALHLWRLAKGTNSKRSAKKAEKQTNWNEKGPLFFHPGIIGGNPAPWLDEETLSYLADSMGYFKTAQPGKILNIASSIKNTVKQGGIPSPSFEKQKQIQTLLILEDEYAEALDWNPISKELAQGMQRYGVPVIYGKFQGSPERFRTLDGMVYHLDELEDQRRGILLLLFTDGKVFHRPQTGFALENLARWPKLVWIELTNQKTWSQFGDKTVSLTSKNKIPIYPGTSEGLIQAVEKFTSEQGKGREAEADFSQEKHFISQADAKYDAWLEYFLGDALLWVQDCSIMQPITPGLADSLRRRFHPYLKPEQIECLYSLPNTTVTDSGLRLSDENMRMLRRGFLQRRSEEEKKEVLQFILAKIEQAKPDAEKESLSHLSWELVYERIKLESGLESDPESDTDEDDLKRFGQLLQGPLAENMSDSLKNYSFADDLSDGPSEKNKADKIPLLIKRPKNLKALLNLKLLPDDPLGIGSLISWMHKTAFAMLIICLLACTGWTVKNYQDVSKPMPNIQIAGQETAPARLEKRKHDQDKWELVKNLTQAKELSKIILEPDTDHRLILYGNGYRTISEDFAVTEELGAKLILSQKDVERPCIESYPEIGLTVQCCPDDAQNTNNEAVRYMSWKERLGDRAPAGRLMSVGLEVFNSPFTRSGFGSISNTLLNTGSVDILYHINQGNNGSWYIQEALDILEKDLNPWIKNSQLIWWGTGHVSYPDKGSNPNEVSNLIRSNEFSEFERVLQIGKNEAQPWTAKLQTIFEPGNDIIVKEQEILKTVEGQASGKGNSIALIRPLKTEYALTVKTTPDDAAVRIMNIVVPQYYGGISLKPGDYEIEVSRDGYETQRQLITMEAENKTIQVTLNPPPKTEFALTVKTVPNNATVRIIDSEKAYHSGIILKPGSYEIEASKQGYETQRQKIIMEEEDKTIEIALTEITTGWLSVTSEPDSASIQISRTDGSETRTLDGDNRVELPVGEWIVKASAPGYVQTEKRVNILKGQEKSILPLKLEPISLKITVPGKMFTEPITDMEFVWIPPGCFKMGSNSKEADSDEKDIQEVCVDGFWMAKTEVTNKQYRQYDPRHNSKDYSGLSLNEDDQPVVYVSWENAKEFAKWLSRKSGQQFHLPTEAQWEYAARGGTNTERYWGDNPDEACKYANVYDQTANDKFSFGWNDDCNDGYAVTSPVGKFKPNDFGLYDMLGNVWEWCEDVYDARAYLKHEANNPVITKGGTFRVVRGGSWISSPSHVRAAYRFRDYPDSRGNGVGFRLCVSQVRQSGQQQ